MDPDGRAVETIWDALNVAIDGASFYEDIRSGNYWGAAYDVASIIYDCFATATPGLPGGTGSAKLATKLTQEYGDDAAGLVLKYADDIAEIVFKGGNSKKLSSNLMKALQLSEKPIGTAAHHIVAGGSRFAKETRKILAKFHIDINDAANGVFLATERHASLHTKKYYEKVQNMLQVCSSREQVIDTLKMIAKELSEGYF